MKKLSLLLLIGAMLVLLPLIAACGDGADAGEGTSEQKPASVITEADAEDVSIIDMDLLGDSPQRVFLEDPGVTVQFPADWNVEECSGEYCKISPPSEHGTVHVVIESLPRGFHPGQCFTELKDGRSFSSLIDDCYAVRHEGKIADVEFYNSQYEVYTVQKEFDGRTELRIVMPVDPLSPGKSGILEIEYRVVSALYEEFLPYVHVVVASVSS